LDSSLNEELISMADEVTSFVDMSNIEPDLTRWRHSNANRAFMPTIQIYSKSQALLGSSGPIKDVPFLETKKGDKLRDIEAAGSHLRVLSRIINEKGKAGWMQLAVPMRQRDMALNGYRDTCIFLSPILLIGLAVSGYLFARHATRPVEQSFDILRNFVADAGHELNTPLAILQANVEALSEELTDLQTTLPIILRTCDRMANLVRDLLLLAKLESPEHETKDRVLIDLAKFTDDLYAEFIRLYEAKGIALSCSAQADLCINGEFDAIHRAVTNLLKNALNYTDNGSVSLTVSKSKTGHFADITVADTGSGIPADSIERIFDRFYRVHKHRARSAGGSGLGLAIVKAIAENHGGSIHVKSVVDEGSAFTLELPLHS
ncbi:MAG: HAMP domain-containing histidine kinase, partial [Candidatus Obscuribacterales bacterium]|nr:HAMP domain-containing histidine kinase [Candidatus Obscuribacterales bacterium]